MGKNKIYLTENGELFQTDLETAEILNDFFLNIVQNLDITRYSNNEPFLDNVKDSTIKAIRKYRNHPSIAAIRNQWKSRASFSFTEVGKKEVKHLILNQDVNKVSQSSDIPLKIVKENIVIFSNFLYVNFSSSVKSRKFPKNLKFADIKPLHKIG